MISSPSKRSHPKSNIETRLADLFESRKTGKTGKINFESDSFSYDTRPAKKVLSLPLDITLHIARVSCSPGVMTSIEILSKEHFKAFRTGHLNDCWNTINKRLAVGISSVRLEAMSEGTSPKELSRLLYVENTWKTKCENRFGKDRTDQTVSLNPKKSYCEIHELILLENGSNKAKNRVDAALLVAMGAGVVEMSVIMAAPSAVALVSPILIVAAPTIAIGASAVFAVNFVISESRRAALHGTEL